MTVIGGVDHAGSRCLPASERKADRVGEGDAVKKAEKDMAEAKALVTHRKCGKPYDY
jgi:hypothetical protein